MQSTAGERPGLSALARPSGAFVMVALDQREALRAMFMQYQAGWVSDEQLTDFKITASAILSPHASAILVDKQFALDRIIDAQVIAPDTALIAAADSFIARGDEMVADVTIDDSVDPTHYRQRGVSALKLLVIYRPDGDPRERIALVEKFVGRCSDAGMISIIEPVSRPPASGGAWSWDDGVLAAAAELGALGADLYKAEVPLHAEGNDDEIRRRCAQITRLVICPWVVLSSGVANGRFPRAVELACREGASGFLAGRAIWRSSIGQPDLERALHERAIPRLQELTVVVDEIVSER